MTGTLSATTGQSVTALKVEGGQATTISVGQLTGGTAAAIALHVKSDATGTNAIPVAINLDGSTATAKDTATVEAKGVVNLNTASADQVEEITLIGNGAVATFNVSGAPTTINVSGSQNVTVAGTAATFSGKTVNDISSATSKLKIQTTAAALDLTKVSVDVVELAVDMAGNVVTADSGEALQVAIAQNNLGLTSAVATKATNSVTLTVDDNLATVGSLGLGVVTATNLATVNVVANENVTLANNSTFGTDGTVKFSGAGTVTVGATGGTVTAAHIDASAAAGVVTAYLGSTATKITTGAGKDVINVEGDTNFTIDGGAALDTVNFGISTLAGDLNVADNTTTVLNNVEVIQFVHDNNARNFTIDSSLLTEKAMVIKGTHASDTVTVAMDGTTVDLTNINLGTNIAKAIITGAAVGSSALTIKGTSMVDEVTGGSQNDNIFTGAGNDVIVDAGDGDDTIDTGEGDDTVTQAGAGNDIITLGAGTNTVTDAGAGNDTITGGTGADTVTSAGSGNDTVNLGNGTNYADGNSGDDVLTGGTGVDTLIGGADKDTLNGDAGADKLYGDNAGTKEFATLTIGGTFHAGDVVTTTIFGKAIASTVVAGDTNLGGVADRVAADITAALGDYVNVTHTTGAATLIVTSKLDGSIVDFATAVTGAGATITGTWGTKTEGTSSAGGADTINAGAGADFVFGGEGKDIIDLGAADGDADVVAYTAFAGGDDIKNFEARTGNDVIKFAQDLFVHGTPTATLASIAANGTVGANDVFVEVTTVATAGVDTAAKMATFLTNLGTASISNGDKILVAANDGTDTYLYAYAEAGTAGAQAAELTLVAKLVGVNDIDNGDLAFFA